MSESKYKGISDKYLGKKFTVGCGWVGEVIKYEGNKNLTVMWQDGSVDEGVRSGNLKSGNYRPRMYPGVVGVGIFDKRGQPYSRDIYWKWSSMIKRCYCDKYQKNKPTYRGTEVCNEWKLFSNFSKWAETYGEIKNLELDKDFLGDGKLYSPETCCFIPNYINSLCINDTGTLSGVSYKRTHGKWEASVSHTDYMGKRKNKYLGIYDHELDAHKAYLEGKRYVVLDKLSWYREESFYDKRVEDAILNSALFSGKEF